MTETADTLEPEVLDPSQAIARHPSGWWKASDGRWISPRDSADCDAG
jgi:hypothetical protein